MKSSYTQELFTKHIKHEIKTIIECGSRDCLDAIEMLKFYKADTIYSFECNPESIIICKENIKNYNNIKLIEYGVYDEETDDVTFFATDMEKSLDKNIGASSMLFHRDNEIEFIQKEIKIKTTTLDNFFMKNNINNIDLLCLDLQGVELNALKGCINNLNKVKYIITEISHRSYYHNDILFTEVDSFLEKNGFKLLELSDITGFGDALYVNKNIV